MQFSIALKRILDIKEKIIQFISSVSIVLL